MHEKERRGFMFSNLRVSGLASGIDTESIIKDLMRAHRIQMDKLVKNRQILEWQQEDYRELNNKIRALRDKAFDMRLQGTYLAKSANSSNETVLVASAGGSAVEGSYSVQVTQLAKSAYVSSSVDIAPYQKTLAEQFGISGEIKFTITNDGIKDSNGNSISMEFTFNTETQSINDIVNEINNWKNEDGIGLGIKASYDKNLNRFFLQTTSTGADQVIKLTDDNDFFKTHLKLDYDDLYNGTGVKGEDSHITFNGAEFTFSSNTVTVTGITMNLRSEGMATISVSRDNEKIFNTIVDFINTYNETIKAISDELYEKRYKDYLPLTDEEREQLTEKQIEQWEEKARSGLLRRDPLLYSITSKMRLTMSAVVPGVNSVEGFNSLDDIGITTTADYMSGTLVIDEDKLRKAIEDDPEGVMNLFTKSAEEYSEMGLAQRLYRDATSGITALIDKAGLGSSYSQVDDSFIGQEIADINKRIESWEERLAKIEDRYWKQFTAMEKAIQRLNFQSMWLLQQFNVYGNY